MSTTLMFDHTTNFPMTDMSYDDGLQHPHDWAAGHIVARAQHPVVAHPSVVTTPSSAFHDDLHYAA